MANIIKKVNAMEANEGPFLVFSNLFTIFVAKLNQPKANFVLISVVIKIYKTLESNTKLAVG